MFPPRTLFGIGDHVAHDEIDESPRSDQPGPQMRSHSFRCSYRESKRSPAPRCLGEAARKRASDVGYCRCGAFEARAEDVVRRLLGVELLDQIWMPSHDSPLTDRAFFGELTGVDGKRPCKERQPEHPLRTSGRQRRECGQFAEDAYPRRFAFGDLRR
jgi:hypothetical protein